MPIDLADVGPGADATASWVIRETATGRVILETYSRAFVGALNTARYEAVPILQHLQEFNRTARP